MKILLRTVFLLALLAFFAQVAPAMGYACTSVNGIYIGNDTKKDETWTFSLVNLTESNIKIGSQNDQNSSPAGHHLRNFPYGTVFPPGNSSSEETTPSLGLTSWKSKAESKWFPETCNLFVPIEISSNSAYNFSLRFNGGNGKEVLVSIAPPVGQSTWRYSTDVNNDKGYYAFSSAQGADGPDAHDGILFALSDQYVVCLYKNNTENEGGNHLILVVTQRNSYNDYHGNKMRYFF